MTQQGISCELMTFRENMLTSILFFCFYYYFRLLISMKNDPATYHFVVLKNDFIVYNHFRNNSMIFFEFSSGLTSTNNIIYNTATFIGIL